MKHILFLAGMLISSSTAWAQTGSSEIDLEPHKIVMQLTSADTNIHKMVVRQIGNLLAAAPNSKIEVVCHGQGINILMIQQTKVHAKIIELKMKGVEFNACENTMLEKKIAKEEIIPEAGYVKVGVLEIVRKQEQGWSYIRAAQ
jgi:intracellular sulfur oxidation DsrE/DsrF family protein